MKKIVCIFIGLLWLMPSVSFASSIQDTIDLTKNASVVNSRKFIKRDCHFIIDTNINIIVFKLQKKEKTDLTNNTLIIYNAWDSNDEIEKTKKIEHDDDSLIIKLLGANNRFHDSTVWYFHVRPQIPDSCFINMATDSLTIKDSIFQYLRWVGITDTTGKAINGISENYRWYYCNSDTLLLCFEKEVKLDTSMSITFGGNTWSNKPETDDPENKCKFIEHFLKYLPYDAICLLMLVAIAILTIRLMKFKIRLNKADKNRKTILENISGLVNNTNKDVIKDWVEKCNVGAIIDNVVGNKLNDYRVLREIWNKCNEPKEQECNGTSEVPTDNQNNPGNESGKYEGKRLGDFLKVIDEELQSLNKSRGQVDTPPNEAPAPISTEEARKEVDDKSLIEALISKIAEHPKLKSLAVSNVDNLDGLLSIIADKLGEETHLDLSIVVEKNKDKFRNPTKDITKWLEDGKFEKIINSYIRKQFDSSEEFESVWDGINTDDNKLIVFCKKLKEKTPTDSSQNTLGSIRQERDRLSRENIDLKSKNEEIQGLLTQAKKDIEDLQSETDEVLRGRIEELNGRIEEMGATITDLTNAKTIMVNEYNGLSKKIGEKEAEINTLKVNHKKELDAKDVIINKLKYENEKKVGKLTSQIKDKEREIGNNNEKIGNLESALQKEANMVVEAIDSHLANLQDELNKSLSGVDEDSPLHKLVTEQVIDNRRCSLMDTINNIKALKNNNYKTTDIAKSEIRKIYEALLAETDPTWLDVAIRLYSYSLVGFVSQQMAEKGILLSRIGAAVDPILKDIKLLGIELIVPSLFNERFDLTKHEKESLKNITRFADDIGSHVFTSDAVIDLYKVGYCHEGKVIEKATVSTYGD